MEFMKENEDFEWHRDNFDFDAFLNDDSLDDRVTAAVDGHDLLEPDALGVSADYIPRRPGDGERGRHEAPEEECPSPDFDPDDPRYAAPERPRVVVAEPRKSVYVTPPGGELPPEEERRPSGGGGGGARWLAAALGVLVVIGVILLIRLTRGGSSSTKATPTPAPTASVSSEVTDAPTDTPAPTEAQKGTYMITVTAGSGGSVSPSGIVSAAEGGSVTFTIRANEGYALGQLLIDGASVTPAESYTFDNVTANHTLYAVFDATAAPTPESTPTPAPTAVPTPTPEPEPTPTPEPEPTPTPAPTPIPPEDEPQDWDDGGDDPIPGGWDEN